MCVCVSVCGFFSSILGLILLFWNLGFEIWNLGFGNWGLKFGIWGFHKAVCVCIYVCMQ